MAIPPIQLQQGTQLGDAYSLINQNFMGSAQNIADLGGKVSDSVIITFPNKGSGLFNQTVSLVNPGQTLSGNTVVHTDTNYQSGQVSLVVPFVDIYSTVDGDPNYRYPYGNSAASANNAIFPLVNVGFTPITGALATVTVGGWNISGSTYTFYFHVQLAYFANPVGVFR